MELDEAVLAAAGPSQATDVPDVALHSGDAAQQQRDADAAAADASLTDQLEESHPEVQRVSLNLTLSFREVRSGPFTALSPAHHRPRHSDLGHGPETLPHSHLWPSLLSVASLETCGLSFTFTAPARDALA